MEGLTCKVCMCDITDLNLIQYSEMTPITSNEVHYEDGHEQLCSQCLSLQQNKIVIKTEYEDIEIEETEILNVNEVFVKQEFDFESSEAATNDNTLQSYYIDFENNSLPNSIGDDNAPVENSLLIRANDKNLERSKTYVKTCFVPNCRNDSYSKPEKVFFAVPKKVLPRKLWFAAVGRQFTPTTNRHCCEDHFDLEEDTQNLFKFKLSLCKHLLLLPSVVPHKFITSPSKTRRRTSATRKQESEDSDNEVLSVKVRRKFSKQRKSKKKFHYEFSQDNSLDNVNENCQVPGEDDLLIRINDNNFDESKELDRLNLGCKMCFVPACQNNSYCAPVKVFLAVPKRGELRKLWFDAVGRKFSRTTNLHCCEDHFNLEEDSENYFKFQLSLAKHLTLKSSVVPHKYLIKANPDVDTSQFKPRRI